MMTHIEQAIKEAVAGGWKRSWLDIYDKNNLERIFLNPLFWQALGKARGWEDDYSRSWVRVNIGIPTKISAWVLGSQPETEWMYHWHRLLDHLAEEKDAESFFATLV